MYLRFIDEEETYVLENDFRIFGGNKICLYETTIPEKNNGFEIVLDNGEVVSFYDYYNIYSKTDEYIIFTSDARIHYIYYIYDEEGYVISYSTSIKELDNYNTIFVRSGIGSKYEVVQLDEFLDENGLSRYKVVDGELKTVTESDLEYLYNRKLQKTKKDKISALSTICEDNIVKGIEYNGEMFSYELTDQNNLDNAVQFAKSTGMDTSYHANGKSYRLFTKDELIDIYIAEQNNLNHNVTYNNQLKKYVESLESIDDVEKVYYGQELTGVYLDTYNQNMNQMQNIVTTFISG